jgi:hypothetical protein
LNRLQLNAIRYAGDQEGALNALIKSIEAEYLRYKALAEAALAQVPEPSLSLPGPAEGDSLASFAGTCPGISSRASRAFSQVMAKPWRNREEEFSPRGISCGLMEKWTDGGRSS